MLRILRTAVVALSFALAACEDPYSPRVGPPAALRHAAGNGQQELVGSALPESLAVRVVDAAGQAVRGVTITWEYDFAAGTVSPGTGVTNDDGIVRAKWTLGQIPGPHLVTATADGLEALVFTAVALAIVNPGPLDWTLVHRGLPVPPDHIIGLAGSNASDVFTATRTGQVYWYDGFGWSELISHDAPGLLDAMWGPASVAVHATGLTTVGDTAFVGRFVGQHWTTPYRITGERFHAIHGTSATNLWAVGTIVVHNAGSAWNEISYGGAVARAVWAANGDTAFVGDMAGAIHIIDTATTTIRQPSGVAITALFGFSPDDVYAGTATGAVLHWDGDQWSPATQVGTGPIRSIWGHVPGELWVVGDAFGRLSAGDWSTLSDDQALAANIVGLWGTSMQDVWAVTDSLRIKHYNGLRWTEHWDSPIPFEGIWGPSASQLHVCGGQGTIQFFDGNRWVTERLDGWEPCLAMHGPTVSMAAAATKGAAAYLFDGTAWERTPTGAPLAGAIWVDTSGIAMAPGPPGMVLRFDGNAWAPLTTGSTAILSTVWGSAPDDVWAGGAGGTLLHYDGNAWSPVSSGVTGIIRRIWGRSATNVYAVADAPSGGSSILHYDGVQWTSIHDAAERLRSIHGRTDSDVFAAGDAGVVLRWDGAQWHTEDTGIDEDLNDVWASPEGDVFAVGARGAIVRGRRVP
jgi:hypothetical protein